jgi:hypothetical protein
MKLMPALVGYIANQVVWRLSREGLVEIDNLGEATAAVNNAVIGDLQVEDRLNEEVREILRERSDEMARLGVQYHDMFRMIKAELVRKRKLIL